MAHAVHPSFVAKHQPQHQPKIHEGIVLKINANQKYATDSITQSIIKVIASRANVPLQEVIIRNDSLGGSTIGPHISSQTGMKTVDVGAPTLGMHSIRETCGTIDVMYYERLFAEFLTVYTELTDNLLAE